jgi:hypothetical protein
MGWWLRVNEKWGMPGACSGHMTCKEKNKMHMTRVTSVVSAKTTDVISLTDNEGLQSMVSTESGHFVV